MSSRVPHVVILTASLLLALAVVPQTAPRAPAIWDDRALAGWATPLAALKVRLLTKLSPEDKKALIAFLRSL